MVKRTDRNAPPFSVPQVKRSTRLIRQGFRCPCHRDRRLLYKCSPVPLSFPKSDSFHAAHLTDDEQRSANNQAFRDHRCCSERTHSNCSFTEASVFRRDTDVRRALLNECRGIRQQISTFFRTAHQDIKPPRLLTQFGECRGEVGIGLHQVFFGER